MNRKLLMLSFAVGCAVAVATGPACRAEEEQWEVKAAGDVFFPDYKTKVGSTTVKADGVLPGGIITLKKGAFSGDLSLRSGTLDINSPFKGDIDRLDVDLKLSWWPKSEKLAEKGIHWYWNLGYHIYDTEWKVGGNTAEKLVHGPYLGLGAFWMLKPMGKLQTTLKAEANGLLAFADVSDDLKTVYPGESQMKVAGGVFTRVGAVFDYLVKQTDKVTWTVFADGGWQYETVFFRERIGRDAYWGPYVRVGTRFMF